MDTCTNILATVRAVHLTGIVYLALMLHPVVRDALGLGSIIKPTQDAATL